MKLSYRRDHALAVITPFKVIQGYWFWYQSEACIQLLISG